jgi:DNA-binding beta-propeller fold protein YncE
MQIGTPGETAGEASLDRPADVAVDSAAGEVYVADTGHRRIAVFDAATGAFKRQWGAYGEAPDAAADPGAFDPAAPPARQFRLASCVELSPDGMVYVCDRTSNRIQVFQKNGTFVKEAVVSATTLGNGGAWDVAFGPGVVYVANGQEQHVAVLDAGTLAVTGTLGAGGRWPGHFLGVGSVATDSQGNLYTGETFEGKRVQKFGRQQ